MTWCQCVCTHHRNSHYREQSRSHVAYLDCEHCQLCDEPLRRHEFTSHVFLRCTCSEYRETA